jgi:hypothetical protein
VLRGLATTEPLWPPIRTTYGWVHRAARLLANEAQASSSEVRCQMEELLQEMRQEQTPVGPLAPAVGHFLKVTASYSPGLFHCYDVAGGPRTNNDLEHYFGSARYHQRRASGRVRAAPATVVRGSVRVLASTASRLQSFGEYELRHPNLERWRNLRESLRMRQEARHQHARFRKDPAAYLARPEAVVLKPSLPS